MDYHPLVNMWIKLNESNKRIIHAFSDKSNLVELASDDVIDRLVFLRRNFVVRVLFVEHCRLAYGESDNIPTLFEIKIKKGKNHEMRIYRYEQEFKMVSFADGKKIKSTYIFNPDSTAEIQMHIENEPCHSLVIVNRFNSALLYIHLPTSTHHKSPGIHRYPDKVIQLLHEAGEKIRAELHQPHLIGAEAIYFEQMILNPHNIVINPRTGIIDGDATTLMARHHHPLSEYDQEAGLVVGVISDDLGFGRPVKRIVLIGDIHQKNHGAITPSTCATINAALRLAYAEKIPVDWFPHSFGVKISLKDGVEGLDASAATARNICLYAGRYKVPINVIIDQICIGAQSYWNALCAMMVNRRGLVMMTKEGVMALTGVKALVAALQGKLDVSALNAAVKKIYPKGNHEIGGYETIYSVNGESAVYSDDLSGICLLLMRHHFFTYSLGHSDLVVTKNKGAGNNGLIEKENPVYREILQIGMGKQGDRELILKFMHDPCIPPPLRLWKDEDYVGRDICKNGECGQHPTTIVQEMQIAGMSCMVIFTPSGPLTPNDSRMIAKAISKGNERLPVILLGNLTGFNCDPLSMQNGQLIEGSAIVESLVTHNGPVLLINMGIMVGGSFVVFSKKLNASLTIFAIQGSSIQVLGANSAAKVVFYSGIVKKVKADERLQKLMQEKGQKKQADALYKNLYAEYEKEFIQAYESIHTVERALKMESIDKIIPPGQLYTAVVDWLGKLPIP